MGGLPPIFSLMVHSVVGELGDGTEVEQGPECEVCHRRPPPEYGAVEYVFDRWNGEDLVTALRVLFVSDRLRLAMESAGLKGVGFEPALVSRRLDGFEIGPDAHADDIPSFSHLRVTGVAQGPELWATSKLCPACGRRIWKPTEIGLLAAATSKVADMPVREVYADSWQGEDIFNLEDRRRLLVTDSFRQVVESINREDASYAPAKWVER